MLLLFMICGHTSLLLFILSYDDNEYKTMKVSKSNWFEKLFYQLKKYFNHNTKQA